MLFSWKSKEIARHLELHPIKKIQFDEHFRCYYDSLKTRGLSASETKHLYWLGSCHSSGFEREKCLRLILKNFEPDDINRVLLRLLDWVPQVRGVADGWLLRHYAEVPIESYLKNLKLISKIDRRPGASELSSVKKLLGHLGDFVAAQPNVHNLISDSKGRKFAIELLSRQGKADTYSFIKKDPDPIIRRMAFSEYLLPRIATDLEHWISDKSVQIKMLLLRNFLSTDASRYADKLYAFVADRNANLRASAGYYLKRDFGFDRYVYYKTQLSEHADYVLFLSDFPKAEDLPTYAGALQSPRKIVALAALRALDSLGRLDLGIPAYFNLLFGKGKIAHLTARRMSKHIPLTEIIAQRDNFLRNHQAFLYAQIVFHLDSTIGLREALLVLDHVSEAPVLRLIKVYIYNASWRPNPGDAELVAEIDMLANRLTQNGKLPSEIRDQIMFILGCEKESTHPT